MTLAQTIPEQPMVTRFLEQAIESHTLSQGYVFKGRNISQMYNTALALAKVLNCRQTQDTGNGTACGQCQDCRWVDSNAHPAVMTISRHTYLVSEDGEDLSEKELAKLAKKSAQTQIKTKQIERLIMQLGMTSEHYRVVIFTDSEETPAAMASAITPPQEWQHSNADGEKAFHVKPLGRQIFNQASANRFLKTLEEPPKKTLFIFLTDADENLLETIVSRCQVLPFLRQALTVDRLDDTHQQFFAQTLLPQLQQPDFYQTVDTFKAQMLDDLGLSVVQALRLFQQFLQQQFVAQPVERTQFLRYAAMQRLIDQHRQMIKDKTHSDQTLNHLFYKLSQLV